MKDKAKQREQLIHELVELRQRTTEPETLEAEHKRAEEALRRLEKAVETMQLGVTITDTDGKILYTNPAEASMHGYTVEDLIGRDVRIFAPSKLWKRMALVQIKEMNSWRRQSVNIRKDGSIFPVQLMSDIVTNAAGELIGIVTSCEDITERRRAEEALKESEEHYRALVENVADAIVINVGTKRVFVNKAFLELHGLRDTAQVLGMPLDQFILPEDRPLVSERTLTRQQGHPAPGVYEYRIRRPDGEIRTVQTSSVAITYKGQPAALAVLRDVTERKRAEAALERLRRQNELILDSAGEGIYGLDLHGNITFVNPAAMRMIGWEAEELIARSMHAVLHHSKPDDTPYPEEECPIYATFKDGAVRRVDNEVFWRKDGTSFPVEYISTPIRERGELVGAVVTFKDITTERQTERLAMLGRVAAGVAHELNNALSVVLACSELLLRQVGPHSEAYHEVEVIEKYAETCRRIAEDLRRLGRPLPLKHEVVNLNHLITEVLKPLELDLAARKVQVSLVLAPRLPSLSADPRLLNQALLNLITNAAAAMPEGGSLSLASRVRQKELVEIAVSDTGVGIAREHLDRIFDPFFTIGSADTGMGLGLTITSRIVEDHGGYIEVKSKVGKGSTFRIILPLTNPEPVER